MSIDYAARLALVTAAINALLAGGLQSYEIEGQKVTKLDLAWLTAEERRLSALVRRGSGRGRFHLAVPR